MPTVARYDSVTVTMPLTEVVSSQLAMQVFGVQLVTPFWGKWVLVGDLDRYHSLHTVVIWETYLLDQIVCRLDILFSHRTYVTD